MQQIYHRVDFCVVGGGMAGMLAAIAAARHGLKVVLMHDRPVLGGNASSEIRMWICGAQGENNRETGILEEILLDNMYRNPARNYSVWDSILYEKVRFEPNIELLLNCSCCGAEMDGDRIRSVKGWQLTTYTWHTVEALYFADCSGDSVLAPLSGAEYRHGREASGEFGEDIAPAVADGRTMGLSCLIQARETGRTVRYIPPEWAHTYKSDEELPFRSHDLSSWSTNFWWMELGGMGDTVRDTEDIRDELLKVAFGVWDHIKNRGEHGADNWELEWAGFLPGKRESRRYVGDYVMTQQDVRAEGRFDDLVAYGGWPMDDHNPAGIAYGGEPTIFHPAPSPFGIAYRCLYSRNIANLFFAGRNISVTHTALSSTRVMGTCSVVGQAVGTAAALACRCGLTPRELYPTKISELKQLLMEDDCYLPWNSREVPGLTKNAAIASSGGNAEALRNGIDRPAGGCENGWYGTTGSWVRYSFDGMRKVSGIRFVFDSDLNRESCTGHKNLRKYPMPCNRFADMEPFGFPGTMLKSLRLEYMDGDGDWHLLRRITNNHQRLVRLDTDISAKALRFIPEETWGDSRVHVFAWEVR